MSGSVKGQMHKFMAVAGSFTIALLLVALVLYVSAQSVEGEPLAAQQNHSIKLPGSLVNTFERSNITSSILSCREGLAGWEPYVSVSFTIQSLGGGHYLDFSAHAAAPQLDAMEFIQLIRVRQKKDSNGNYLPRYTVRPPLTDTAGGLGQIITSAPGSLWLVGNEPDRGPDYPGGPPSPQDDTNPGLYAEIYHEVYQFIKKHDPTAQVGIAGLVEVTPGRLQYLDIVWDTYVSLYREPMPVDVWNMHIYILPEVSGIANVALGTDPALAYGLAYVHTSDEPNVYTFGDHDNMTVFDSQVRLMRQWMKDHGQRDRPLLLSEFGLLYDEDVTDEFGANFTVSRAATFLTRTFSYLVTTTDASLGMPSDGNRLVQQWVWFSAYEDPLGHIGNLLTTTTPLTLTSVGNRFRANVATRPLQSNLRPRTAFASTPILGADESSTTATLSVEMVNNGNQLVSVPFTVTFYANAALTEVIDSTVVTSGVPGCARRRVAASVAWPELGVGLHDFWVRVDASYTVSETNEADNLIKGQTFIGTHGVNLPLAARNSP